MTDAQRDTVLNTFIDMLRTVVPDLVAVYEFEKKIAKFDPMLKGSKGLVIILDRKDYFMDNLLFIDLVYDRIQDIYGWPEGVRLANSFSRPYIRTPNNLYFVNPLSNNCLLPEDTINLRDTANLIYGRDILKDIEYPYEDKKILKVGPPLKRKDVAQLAKRHIEYYPLIDPDCSWMPLPFVVSHPVIDILKNDLVNFNADGTANHTHIYGRYCGSGKTQIMHGLMKTCKQYGIPFIYRTEFWKDENGNYIDEEYNPTNEPAEVAKWVAENAPNERFVIFLDECDIDISKFKNYLTERFHGKKPKFLIISGAKEIPVFVDKNTFHIYDINKEYPYSPTNYKYLLKKLMEMSHVDSTVFMDESVEIIANHTKLWFLTSNRSTPQAVIAAATLALAETLIIAEKSGEKPIVFPDTAKSWALYSSSPWWQRFPENRDTHAEFLIYNGREYTDIDPHYKLTIP